jgi:hypothetical protein
MWILQVDGASHDTLKTGTWHNLELVGLGVSRPNLRHLVLVL